MIVKFYGVHCDICDNPLGSYPFRPTATKLRECNIKVKFQNGIMKTLCKKVLFRIK